MRPAEVSPASFPAGLRTPGPHAAGGPSLAGDGVLAVLEAEAELPVHARAAPDQKPDLPAVLGRPAHVRSAGVGPGDGRMTMEIPRICATDGCGTRLRSTNPSRVCSACEMRERNLKHRQELRMRAPRRLPPVRTADPVETGALPICVHGCGKPRHKGRCGKRLPPPAVTLNRVELDGALVEVARLPESPAPAMPVAEKGKRMDQLKFRVVLMADLPAEVRTERRATGRMGQLWAELLNLTPGVDVLEVVNRDREHLGMTSRYIRTKAKKLNVPIDTRASGTMLYLWRTAA